MRDTKGMIVRAAYDLMGTRGLEDVHARTVAATVKVNHATVHYYFAKRDDLLCAVADYALEVMNSDRKRFQEGATTPREQVEAEIALAEAYAKKGSRFARVIAGLVVAGASSPNVRKRTKVLWQAWASAFVVNMPAAKPKKDATFADPELMMATLFGLALANLALDGGINVESKLDAVHASLFG